MSDFLWMYNATIGEYAQCTQEQFDQIYTTLGWVLQDPATIDTWTEAVAGGKADLSFRRLVGRSTVPGPPASGTFAVDDEIIDSNGQGWRCTVAGTPGTWVAAGAGSATSLQPDVIMHAPTGIVGTDRTVLSDAITDCPANGLIYMVGGGDTPYATDEAWTITKSLSVVGTGCSPVSFANGETALASPFLTGAVILQTAAATDGVLVNATDVRVNLRGFGVRFDNPGTVAFANTGDGFKAVAAGIGIVNSAWEDLWSFGHDGDHWGFRWGAPLLCRGVGFRTVGGGVVRVESVAATAAGNCVFIQPFGTVCVDGAADAFSHKSNSAGAADSIELISYYRPQANFNDFSASAAYGNPTAPTQRTWNDHAGTSYPEYLNAYDVDLEPGGLAADAIVGERTRWWGLCNADDTSQAVLIGNGSHLHTPGLQSVGIGNLVNSTGQGATAIGNGAVASANVSTAIGDTASASAAGAVAIGVDSGFAGAAAATANYFVLGTANHKYFLPGLPTSDPAVAGQLWKNDGIIQVSGADPTVPLGTIPVFATLAAGLTTSLAAVGGSWWILDPAAWPTPPSGQALQYRFHAQAGGGTPLTNGDVFGVQPYNNTDATGLIAEFTKAADATGLAEAVSPWTNFPASRKAGYVQVRNQTGARGVAVSCFIEVAIR